MAKAKLKFDDSGVKVKLKDAGEVGSYSYGEVEESKGLIHPSTPELVDILTEYVYQLQYTLDIMDDIERKYFYEDFGYKYEYFLKFKNYIESQINSINDDLVEERSWKKFKTNYNANLIVKATEYLKNTFVDEPDFVGYDNIKKFNDIFKTNKTDSVNEEIDTLVNDINSYSDAEWDAYNDNIKKALKALGVDLEHYIYGAKKSDTFGEIIFTNNFGQPVLGINLETKQHRLISPKGNSELEEIELELEEDTDNVEEVVAEEEEEIVLEDAADVPITDTNGVLLRAILGNKYKLKVSDSAMKKLKMRTK